MSFPDKNSVKVWIITHQIGKRNLNDYLRSVMALKLEELLKPIARENQLSTLKQYKYSVVPNLAQRGKTRDKIASVAHVSHGTLDKVKLIEAKATPEQKASLASGEASINEVYNKIKIEVHFSSKTCEWTTPQNIIDATLKTLSVIDLDPCADGFKNIPAQSYLFRNGLEKVWSGRVYINPPYGDVIGLWVNKLNQEYISGHVTEAIALVPARTDTEWFRFLRNYPVCFINGRLKFGNTANSAPFPSAVFYLGENLKSFYSSFKELGDIWVRFKAD
jgi:hypothetical protein